MLSRPMNKFSRFFILGPLQHVNCFFGDCVTKLENALPTKVKKYILSHLSSPLTRDVRSPGVARINQSEAKEKNWPLWGKNRAHKSTILGRTRLKLVAITHELILFSEAQNDALDS